MSHQDRKKIGPKSSVAFTKASLKRKNKTVNFEATKPTFFWSHVEFSGWIADPLRHPIVSGTRIAFDYPSRNWPRPTQVHLVDMRLGRDGHYHWQTPNNHYYGVRTETETHVVLSGAWLALGRRGDFVAVFPKHSAE
jgi:hypothetical protein